MDIRQFENIKQKIEVLKQKKAKAEGSIESIETGWKNQYGFTTITEAEAKLKEYEDTINKNTDTMDTLYEELNGLTNWSLV